MSTTTVKLLKNVEFYYNQEKQTLQSAQAKLLIAYCVEKQDSLSRSMLAELFWPDRSESEGLKLLRNLLSRIGKTLPSLFEVNRYTVQLVKTNNSFDTLEIQELSKSSLLRDWQKAVSLYSGSFLEEIAQKHVPEGLKEWLELRRQFYQHSYVNCLHKLVHALSDTSKEDTDFELAMFYIETWQAEEPDNERIYIHKLSLLAKQFKYDELERHYALIQAESLNEYTHKAITQFYQSLDIPNPKDRPIRVDTKPAARAKEIIGRKQDIEQVDALLQEHPVVSIVGIGGIGKTHVTEAIVDRANNSFTDGVVFVPLALTSSNQFFNHLMRALGIYKSSQHNPKDEIIKNLREKKFLLVLDNAEHLNKELGPFLSELISKTKYLRCLLSSRTRLSISIEQVYPLGVLDMPNEDTSLEDLKEIPTAQLLVKQAQHYLSDLTFEEKYRETIIELCHLSHGLPLAIEIIAANFLKMPIQELADKPLSLTKPLDITSQLDSASQLDNTSQANSFIRTTRVVSSVSTNQQASNSEPISSSPINASPTNTEPINASPTNAEPISSDPIYLEPSTEIIDINILKKLRAGNQENNARRSTPRLRSQPRRTKIPQNDSLKNCFEYSWALLEEKHQTILAKQAVFWGGFSFQAFKEVTGGNAYDLAVLINTSLVRRTSSGRYERHPLIYQFCQEKLNSLVNLKEETEKRHAKYFVRLAQQLQEYIDNYKPNIALILEPEVNNFRRAIEYSVRAKDLQMLEPLVVVFTSVLVIQGRYPEAITLCESVMQYNQNQKDKNVIIEFFLQLWISYFHSQVANIEQAEIELQKTESMLDNLKSLMSDSATQESLGVYQKSIPFYLGFYQLAKGIHLDNKCLYEEAKFHFQKVIELHAPFLKTHSNTVSIFARNRLAFLHHYLNDLEKAKELFEENLAYGDYFLQGLDTISLGNLLMYQNDSQAESMLLQGLELSVQRNMQLTQGFAHQYLGLLYTKEMNQNNTIDSTNCAKKALNHLNKALNLGRELSENRLVSYTLSAGFAQLYMNRQQWLKAQEYLYEALQLAADSLAQSHILVGLLRLATMDLQFDNVAEEYKTTAITCLELVVEHPASQHRYQEAAKTLLAQEASGELQKYSLRPEQQQQFENNRNMPFIYALIELLNLSKASIPSL